MGVKNIITFDAPRPPRPERRPLLSFDNAMPTYQVLKSLLQKMPDLSFDKKDFMVVSPDEGAMNRNMYFSSGWAATWVCSTSAAITPPSSTAATHRRP